MSLATFFDRLDQHLKQELPLVVYRKAGKAEMMKAFLQKDTSVYKTETFSESGFVFSPFDQEKGNLLIPLDKSEEFSSLTGEEIIEGFGSDPVGPLSNQDNTLKGETPTDKAEHIKLVEQGVTQLKSSDLEKVVLSRQEVVPLKGKHPLVLFQELVRIYPAAMVYCWYHPETGFWLGATPETLVEVNGLSFKTMALAGTQKYNGTLEVSWGTKELQEQQYVTDSIIADLKETKAVDDIKVSEVRTAKAGKLLHLRTDISGRLKAVEDLGRIIEKLHPTPAVCGLPKKEAKEFILRTENYDREFYTGFLGELNVQTIKNRSQNRRNTENLVYLALKKKTNLYVNLRCMKLEGGNAILFIGGGITEDSIAEDEWQETVNKAGTMKRVLQN